MGRKREQNVMTLTVDRPLVAAGNSGSGTAQKERGIFRQMTHPHPSREHVMRSYRRYILGCKSKFGTARSQVHYRELLQEYLAAKRALVARIPRCLVCGEKMMSL